MRKFIIYMSLITLLFHHLTAYAEEDEEELLRAEQQELIQLDIADLLNMEVTSVTKKSQKLSDSAAAIFVITQEDIQRSGATHITDLLRMVPGINVAQFNSHGWIVASRGTFNGSYVNKLLVLIDGRSIYNMQMSHVYWDVVNMPLSEIERIEVIRGPGGALWGANAVNGVINIITKLAKDSQGTVIEIGGGHLARSFEFRHGGQLSEEAESYFKVYGKKTNYQDLKHAIQPDNWQVKQMGFRIDNVPNEDTDWTIQGEIYDGKIHDINWQTLASGKGRILGSHILNHWSQRISNTSTLNLKMYYDQNKREFPSFAFDNRVFDFELEHQWALNLTHELNWGLGYRWLYSYVSEEGDVKRLDARRHDQLISAFIQDEIDLKYDELRLFIGSKFEYNNYTGFEVQPNIRLLWTPPETQYSFWTAISRVVRTPSQVSHHIFSDLPISDENNPFYPMPFTLRLTGNNDVISESTLVYELGIRHQLNDTFSWDATAFFNDYDDLIIPTENVVPDLPNQRIFLVREFFNGMSAKSFGTELSFNWQATDWWKLHLNYSWLKMNVDLYDNMNSSYESVETESPEHQWTLRSSMNLPHNVELDAWAYYVSRIGSDNLQPVDAYTSFNLKLGWHITDNLSLSVAGYNLFDSSHLEYSGTSFNPLIGEIPRSIYAQVRWQF